MPVTPLRDADPVRVGPHRLLGRLGQGGMGTVFLGVTDDDRAVAVKVLRDGLSDPDARRRFRHELEALRRVRGPHLVEVLDADVDADLPYLVTRFVPGTRLDDLVNRNGPLDVPALQVLARGLADALTVLHAQGVVHRDLTPGNVLVLDGQPHVIDLGLAIAADVTALTRSGLVIGTPGYLAPEQVTGTAVTEAVDVHAWGATVAFAATGRPPYGTGRPEAVLYRLVHGRPDLDGVPEVLAALVGAAMDADPRRRPAARTLLDQLGGASHAETVQVRLPRDVDPTAVLGGTRELAAATSGPRRRVGQVLFGAPAVPDRGPVAPGLDDGQDGRATVAATRVDDPLLPADPTVRQARSPVAAPSDQPTRVAALPSPPRPRHVVPWSDPRHGELAGPWPPDPRTADLTRHDDGGWRDDPRDGEGWDGEGSDDGTGHDGAWHDGGRGDDSGVLAPLPARTHPARAAQVGLTAVAALAVVGAGTLVAPVVGAAAALVLLVALRAAGRSGERLRDRRDRRGERRRDPLVATLGAPWHVLLALGDTLTALPLLLLAAAVPAGLVYLADPVLQGLERDELTAATATVVVLAAGLARRVHRRSRLLLRRTLQTLTPGAASSVALVTALALIAVLLVATAEGRAPVLWPLPDR